MALPWSSTITDWLRARLLGVKIDDEYLATNWSPTFVERMRNRLMIGCFRYGHMFDPAALRFDNVRSAISRLERYLADGNLEHLVDAANLCLLEFVKGPKGLGSHPSPRWTPTDDGEHTEEI